MKCRVGCGACCIALSISSPIPGMPDGKPAGIRCINLDTENLCILYDLSDRPEVCIRLLPNEEMCRTSAEEALEWLSHLEQFTQP